MLQDAAAAPYCVSNMQHLSSPFSVYVIALASGMPSSSVIRHHEVTAFQSRSPPASSPSSSSTAAAPTITSNPSFPPRVVMVVAAALWSASFVLPLSDLVGAHEYGVECTRAAII